MNVAFEMGINALEATLILNFLAKYFGYRTEAASKYWGTILIWCLSFVSISFFSWTHLYESYASSLQILFNIIFCVWLLNGKGMQKVFISVFTMGLVAIVATVTVFLFGKISNNQLAYLMSQFSTLRMSAVLVSKLVFFAITRIILQVRANTQIKIYDFIPLIIVPSLSIITITLMTYATMAAPEIQNYSFYSICIILVLNIMIYLLFIRLSRVNKMELEVALLNLQNECMEENAKNIEGMYENVCALRHDLKNHLLGIAAMADAKNIEGIKKHTASLLYQQEQNDKVMVFSENKILDAIISSKQNIAERDNIHFHVFITDSLLFIEPEDICTLIGNTLDNAIRAAKSNENKDITLHIQPQGSYSAITVSNSIAASVLSANPSLQTSKANRQQHGFGIKNMRKVVEKYQGMIEFYERDSQFVCDILVLKITK